MIEIQLMIKDLIFLPKWISLGALILLVVAGIQEYRQGHIGRVGIAANALLLWQIFYASWASLPGWFAWYLNIGSVVGVIALISYLLRESLPSEFYSITYLAYGSISVVLIVILGATYGILPF